MRDNRCAYLKLNFLAVEEEEEFRGELSVLLWVRTRTGELIGLKAALSESWDGLRSGTLAPSA